MTKKKKSLFTPARLIALGVLIFVAICIGTGIFLADKNVAVLNPQGVIAEQQRDLIVFTSLLSLVVIVPVFLMLGIFAWKYREGNTNAKYTPDADGNKWLELLWWGIPIIIIIVLSVITWVTTHQLDPYKSIASDKKPLKVQVVSLQWKWLFLYPEQKIASVNELIIPVDTTVDFELTADGPMSAFWIPNLGSQTYAMSGMSSKLSLQAGKEGTFRGSNTNITGKGYAGMHFNTYAVSDAAFNEWATGIEADEKHDHLDAGIYETLAKPSEKNPVMHYHLHDTSLYTEIVKKYMPQHGSSTDDKTHNSGSSH